MVLLVLFESAVGYSLMEVTEAEEIGMTADSVQEAVADLARFGKICKMKCFQPFQSAEDALENINSLSEGIMHPRLKVFLETNMPKGKKVTLGVADSKIGQVIKETLKCECLHVGVVPELLRGIRQHFGKMANVSNTIFKAQLGLGHSYSRAKVKFNVHRADNMIIQAICLLDQLDKDINTFSMRMREWYSYHFPELVKIVNDNQLFAKLALMIGRRTTLSDASVEELEAIVQDNAKAQQILEASRSSMGMDISDIDLTSVCNFARRCVELSEYRKNLHQYLITKMHNVAPNLAGLIGEQVGARLISHAGSLTNLAKYPASTVQILGAEKALFRALKTKSNTPKYGIIFHSSFIGRAGAKNKGRISRFLANKCSIASRIDCFGESLSDKFGEELKKQVEERLTFYETGEAPRKNIDVMKGVLNDIGLPAAGSKRAAEDDVEGEKKKKKDKKKEKDADEMVVSAPASEKKKDKKKDKKADEEEQVVSAPASEKKKDKKEKKKEKKAKKDDSDDE